MEELSLKGHDWNMKASRFPTPVACAVGWPEGLNYLISKGTDVVEALDFALKFGVNDALTLLISQKCPAFYEIGHFNRIKIESWVLNGSCPLEMRQMVVQHVVWTRAELARLAMRLPREIWERQHVEDLDTNLDKHALDAWNALEANFEELPPSFLWPGTNASVYHTLQKSWMVEEEAPELAGLLWNSGFKDLDIVNSEGWTAASLACAKLQFPLAKFLFDKGAKVHPDCLWMSARSMPSQGEYLPPQWMVEMFQPTERDSCACFCGLSGCTPATVLIRNPALGFLAQRRISDEFIQMLPKELREECHVGAVRLDIFERLGMAHTCCRDNRNWKDLPISCVFTTSEPGSWTKPPVEEIQEMKSEDSELNCLLQACLDLFHSLRDVYPGRFHAFLHAWRAAFDLYLPPDETTRALCHNQLDQLTGTGDRRPDLEYLPDARGIQTVVACYTDFFDCIEHYVDQNASPGLFDELFSYCPEANIAPGLEKINQGHWEFEGPYAGYQILFYPPTPSARREERIKRSLIRERGLPLLTATIIRDLSTCRRDCIPADLLRFLDVERVTLHGSLPQVNLRLVSEDIFEQGLGIFTP